MVTRYDPVGWCAGMDEAASGGYVRIDDYADLQSENERLKAERVGLEQFREAVGYMIDCAETDAELAQARSLLALIDAHKGE